MIARPMPLPKTHPKDTYTWREEHVGRLLLELTKDFQFRSLTQLRDLGYEEVTLADINIIAAIDIGGTRLTDIAKSLDISKQAAGQMVKALVARGYVSREADPNDGRATLVTFTERGEQLLGDARAGIEEIEALYAALLGERFEGLKADLTTLLKDRTR